LGPTAKRGDSRIFNKSSISQITSTLEYFPHMIRPFLGLMLGKIMKKPYSRARKTTENSLGLLTQIFGAFYMSIPLKTDTVDNLVLPS